MLRKHYNGGSPKTRMRGVLATLSVLSVLASLSVGLAYLLKPELSSARIGIITLWAATLAVGLVTGAAARRTAARERVGLMRSTVALFVAVVALVVGVLAFLM